jgi:hypothetical protein
MSGMLQLTAECAYVTVEGPVGRAKTLLYKGAVFPASAPEAEHLTTSKMCVPFGDDGDVGLNAEGGLGPAETDASLPGSVVAVVSAAPDVVSPDEAERRAAAVAKLDEAGGVPDGRHGEDVWVEYAVRQGLDRDEARRAGKEELRKALAK